MVLKRRPDAHHVGDVPALRRIIPFVMPTRTESLVYFQQRIEVDDLLAWLEATNADRPRPERVTLFHVFLTAIARTVRLRPETNRFVSGRRTYEHDEISVSFVVRQGMADDAEESEARVVLSGTESVDDVRRLVDIVVRRERAGVEQGGDDRLVHLFASWPRPVLNGVARSVRWLDYHNLLRASLVESIPLYTSVYVVHAGSIGIDPPLHHLYELGSASAFVAIGRVAPQPVVDASGEVVARRCVDVAYTLDERATDGFYFAKTARGHPSPGVRARPARRPDGHRGAGRPGVAAPGRDTAVTSLLLRRAPGARGVVVEVGVVVVALAANLLARWLTLDDLDVAVSHAHSLLALEQRLGLDWERAAQAGITGLPWLATLASWFYVWGYLPVLALALVVLFVRRPADYAFLRNALLAGGVVGLPVYVLWPLAPPRLTDLGYADTIAPTVVDALARPVGVANEIAAMPSFHVGYLVIVSTAVWGLTGSTPLRAWCVLHPLVMGWVVLATGNHWVLDLPAGATLALVGLGVARWIERRAAHVPARGVVRPYEPLPHRPSVGRWRGGHDG